MEGVGAPVITTVSGGADSMALLVALSRIGADFVAAHCNFHLRGEESDRDGCFVEDACRRLGVRLRMRHFDVEAWRRDNGGSVEMACRTLRYDWFRMLRRELGASRILTAHHADDNVETMLLNMLRGCGLEGAKGMVEDTGEILRPLLRCSRRDTEAYLEALGEGWIVDSSNRDDTPDRNFIRLKVIPLLENRWCGVGRRLAATQERLGEAWKIYDAWRDASVSRQKLTRQALRLSPSPSTLLHEWLRGCRFAGAQEQEMLRAFRAPFGGVSRWESAASAWSVELSGEGFLRYRTDAETPWKIEWEEMEVTHGMLEKIGSLADADRAYLPGRKEEYAVRFLCPGDRLSIAPGRSKKVSDVLKEGRIPVGRRKSYPLVVLAASGEVVWVPGLRRGYACLLQPDSDRCVVARFLH